MAVRSNLISFQLNRRENNIELLPLDLLRQFNIHNTARSCLRCA
jgi:hypothetical protein